MLARYLHVPADREIFALPDGVAVDVDGPPVIKLMENVFSVAVNLQPGAPGVAAASAQPAAGEGDGEHVVAAQEAAAGAASAAETDTANGGDAESAGSDADGIVTATSKRTFRF
jgi:hypothetical protein